LTNTQTTDFLYKKLSQKILKNENFFIFFILYKMDERQKINSLKKQHLYRLLQDGRTVGIERANSFWKLDDPKIFHPLFRVVGTMDELEHYCSSWPKSLNIAKQSYTYKNVTENHMISNVKNEVSAEEEFERESKERDLYIQSLHRDANPDRWEQVVDLADEAASLAYEAVTALTKTSANNKLQKIKTLLEKSEGEQSYYVIQQIYGEAGDYIDKKDKTAEKLPEFRNTKGEVYVPLAKQLANFINRPTLYNSVGWGKLSVSEKLARIDELKKSQNHLPIPRSRPTQVEDSLRTSLIGTSQAEIDNSSENLGKKFPLPLLNGRFSRNLPTISSDETDPKFLNRRPALPLKITKFSGLRDRPRGGGGVADAPQVANNRRTHRRDVIAEAPLVNEVDLRRLDIVAEAPLVEDSVHIGTNKHGRNLPHSVGLPPRDGYDSLVGVNGGVSEYKQSEEDDRLGPRLPRPAKENVSLPNRRIQRRIVSDAPRVDEDDLPRRGIVTDAPRVDEDDLRRLTLPSFAVLGSIGQPDFDELELQIAIQESTGQDVTELLSDLSAMRAKSTRDARDARAAMNAAKAARDTDDSLLSYKKQIKPELPCPYYIPPSSVGSTSDPNGTRVCLPPMVSRRPVDITSIPSRGQLFATVGPNNRFKIGHKDGVGKLCTKFCMGHQLEELIEYAKNLGVTVDDLTDDVDLAIAKHLLEYPDLDQVPDIWNIQTKPTLCKLIRKKLEENGSTIYID